MRSAPRAADFFDLKGVLEALAARLGVGAPGDGAWRRAGVPASRAVARPSGSADAPSGTPARCTPTARRNGKRAEPVFVAELDVEALPAAAAVRARGPCRASRPWSATSRCCAAPTSRRRTSRRSCARRRVRCCSPRRSTARYDRPPVPRRPGEPHVPAGVPGPLPYTDRRRGPGGDGCGWRRRCARAATRSVESDAWRTRSTSSKRR